MRLPWGVSILACQKVTMPNTELPIIEAATPLSLSATEELSLPESARQLGTLNWLQFLETGLGELDSSTIIKEYQQLMEEFNSLLQHTAEEPPLPDEVYALLQHLLGIYVYGEIAAKNHPLTELSANQWPRQALEVLTKVPQNIYFEQLNRLVNNLYEKRLIKSTVDHALFALHQRTLMFYFQQFLEGLNPTRDNHPSDKEENLCQIYIEAINRVHVYSTLFSTLLPTEKKHLSTLLLDQLCQLIIKTSTLDLSPSWMESLMQWIQWCFSRLRLWHMTSSCDAKPATSPLLLLSRRLKKSTKEAVRGKERQSHQSLRQSCWLYFSLHEHFVSLWDTEEEQHALEYQATALALFDSFMNTFDWPKSFKKGILNENPLQKPQRWTSVSCIKPPPVNEWKPLLDTALNKLGIDLLIADWFGHFFTERSFLHWLVWRQEPRLMAKLKAYASTEGYREYEELNKIPFLEKETLYNLIRAIHEDFCSDLNKITQMILSLWFQKIGIRVPRTQLANVLLKPGRWLHQTNHELITKWEDTIPNLAQTMLQAIERLGGGLFFFPRFQQRWSAFQEKLAVYPHNPAEFVSQHHAEIAELLKQLLLILHPDHKSEADKNNHIFNAWAKRYIPRIQDVKRDLPKFKAYTPKELQSLIIETAGQSVLNRLKNLVLDCMNSQVWYVRWELELISVSPKLQLNYNTLRQGNAELKKIRQEKEAEIKEKDALLAKERKENEALLAKERQEKDVLLAKEQENEALLAKERKENEALLAKERKEKDALLAKERQENEALLAKERKENEALLAKERQEKDVLLAKERKEKEELKAELERLKSSVAKQEGSTPTQAIVSGSRVTLFSVPASSQVSMTGGEHSGLPKSYHA